MASLAVARWWRQQQRDNPGVASSVPQGLSPRALISYLAATPEGRRFLESSVADCVRRISRSPRDASIRAEMASYLEKLRRHKEAAEQLEEALACSEEGGDDSTLRAGLARVRRQLAADEKREALLASKAPLAPLGRAAFAQHVETRAVERRSASSLSLQEFLESYASRGIPLVITDFTISTPPWTLQHIAESIGEKSAPLRRLVPASVDWARLEPARDMRIADFISTLSDDAAAAAPREELLYLFDYQLPANHCDNLLKELRIPRYFANDFLQRVPPGSLYRDSWPSLFIGPRGARSELHVDTFGSNFWMGLMQGRKRWIFFPPEQQPLLYPRYEESMDAVFDVSLFDEVDFDRFPAVRYAVALETVLQPGEILFVPAGSPHCVENLDNTLAISANYVDSTNIDQVRHELAIAGLCDERSAALLEALNDLGDVDLALPDLAWTAFKREES